MDLTAKGWAGLWDLTCQLVVEAKKENRAKSGPRRAEVTMGRVRVGFAVLCWYAAEGVHGL